MLKPGGTFYMCEIHPLAVTLKADDGRYVISNAYFGNETPVTFETTSTYIDPDAIVDRNVEHGWYHSLGEILTSLLDAGLDLEFVHEHRFAAYRMLPEFVRDEQGWRLPPPAPSIPLLFSVRALSAHSN
jgi:hypothetical protein